VSSFIKKIFHECSEHANRYPLNTKVHIRTGYTIIRSIPPTPNPRYCCIAKRPDATRLHTPRMMLINENGTFINREEYRVDTPPNRKIRNAERLCIGSRFSGKIPTPIAPTASRRRNTVNTLL